MMNVASFFYGRFPPSKLKIHLIYAPKCYPDSF